MRVETVRLGSVEKTVIKTITAGGYVLYAVGSQARSSARGVSLRAVRSIALYAKGPRFVRNLTHNQVEALILKGMLRCERSELPSMNCFDSTTREIKISPSTEAYRVARTL